MNLIQTLIYEGKLKDNLHDVRWKLTSNDKEAIEPSHALHNETCADCGGYVIELGVEGLLFTSQACMRCGKYVTSDFEMSKVFESGGGYGAVQLVTKDRSTVLNYGFKERLMKKTLRDLQQALVRYPEIDLEQSFVSMRTSDGKHTVYWLGKDIDDSFYEKLFQL